MRNTWAGIIAVLCAILAGSQLHAQDLVVTGDGDLFLCTIDSSTETTVYFSFREGDRSYVDSLSQNETAYAGDNYLEAYLSEPGTKYTDDLLILRDGRHLLCKITAQAGIKRIEYDFVLGRNPVSTSIGKEKVVLMCKSFRERLDPEARSRAYTAGLPAVGEADEKTPARRKAPKDLIRKVDGKQLECTISEIRDDHIRYRFFLNGREIETGVPRDQVHFLVHDHRGEFPKKQMITPQGEEDYGDLIISRDAEVIRCFIEKVGSNTLEYILWNEGEPEYRIIRLSDVQYFGEDFLDVLNREVVEASAYEDLILTRQENVLLCKIEDLSRTEIRYSFMIGDAKVGNAVHREDVIYAGTNFYRPSPEEEVQANPSESQVARVESPAVDMDGDAPEIIIVSPKLDGEFRFEEVPASTEAIELSGVVLDKSPVKELRINGKPVAMDERGRFSTLLDLRDGMNRIRFTCSDQLDNTFRQEYTMNRSHPGVQLVEETRDMSPPEIKLLAPELAGGPSFIRVGNGQKSIVVTGTVADESGVFEVLINGRDAVLSSSGEFRGQVMLRVGENQVVLKASDVEMNVAMDTFRVIRSDAMKLAMAPDIMDSEDRYFALIIGVSQYADPMIPNLDGHPTKDAVRLAELLTERYMFEEENLTLFLNPKRAEILKSFDILSREVTENDNLLIFFAGHGYYNEDSNLGYWLPSDAEYEFTPNYIYNDVLVANLRRIHSRHTLLISDACFSGSIFKTRTLSFGASTAYQKKYEMPSRKAITSGVLEAVPNKSVFFHFLIDRLEANQEQYMTAGELFHKLEFPVTNSSPNSPQYGTIQNVNDEGGDFIFIRR